MAVCGDLDERHLLESTDTGVAAAVHDGDGDEDLHFAAARTTDGWFAARRPRANALYCGEGDGTFTDAAREAGVAGHRTAAARARPSASWVGTATSSFMRPTAFCEYDAARPP